MPRKPRVIRESLSPVTFKVAEMIALEVNARVGSNATFEESEDAASAVAAEVATGPDATFEQQQDAAAAISSDALWLTTDNKLRRAVTTADEVEVDGCCYRRLDQPSSAIYYSRWGDHYIEEPLYRQVGVHNGPTIKPLELRVGIIEKMTPEMARIVGELSAEAGSRSVAKTLRVTGLVPPSRAFIAKRTTGMGVEIAAEIEELEQAARDAEAVPAEVGSVELRHGSNGGAHE
jgi:hypothetical protein